MSIKNTKLQFDKVAMEYDYVVSMKENPDNVMLEAIPAFRTSALDIAVAQEITAFCYLITLAKLLALIFPIHSYRLLNTKKIQEK